MRLGKPTQQERFYDVSAAAASTVPAGATVTQNGARISITVPGGTLRDSPDEGALVFFRLLDSDGRPITNSATKVFGWMIRLTDYVPPGATSDTILWAGITNGTDPATMVMYGGGVKFTSSKRQAFACRVNSGASYGEAAEAIGSATAEAEQHIFSGPAFQPGRWSDIRVMSLNSDGTRTSSGGTVEGVVTGADVCVGDMYLCVAVGRSSTAAGDATVEVRVSTSTTAVVDTST